MSNMVFILFDGNFYANCTRDEKRTDFVPFYQAIFYIYFYIQKMFSVKLILLCFNFNDILF